MIWTTLVALLIALTASGCKKDTPEPKPQEAFRQVTLKGFSYICPTILKPVQLADREQTSQLFTLYGDDVTNSIACSVMPKKPWRSFSESSQTPRAKPTRTASYCVSPASTPSSAKRRST